MSERPNAVLALLLGIAIALAALIGAALAALGGAGIATLALGIASFCVLLLGDAGRLPLGWIALSVLAGTSLIALARTLAAHRRERRLLCLLPLEPARDGQLLVEADLAGASPLFLLPTKRPTAFCFGILRPRVVVSTGLLDRLDPEERSAVLWHEGYHARDRVPLKCLLARLAARTFFWVPLLRALLERYLLLKEIAADRAAVARAGLPALTAALAAAAREPTPAGAVGLTETAAARIERLLDPDAPLPPLARPLPLLTSILAVIVLALFVLTAPTIGVVETGRLNTMLTTFSLHGLAGMGAGLAANAVALAVAGRLARSARKR